MRSATGADPVERERGGVTAEFAVALPAVVLVLLACLSGMQVVAQSVRLQDAAAVSARSLARGEQHGAVAARAARLVSGARLSTSADGDLECATLRVRAHGAAGVIGRIGLEARSCALGGGR